MKILYDYQVFSSQKYGGISRYFYEIIKGQNYYLPIIFNQNIYLKKGISIPFNFKGKVRVMNFINRKYSKLYMLFNKDYDIFHPTYYHPYFLKYIDKKPFVLTIHDMIHELFPEFFQKDKTSQRKQLLAKKAKRVIAVSENTKKDIIKILNIDESKIDVIYHGSDFDKISEDNVFKNKLPQKYVLFTGNRNGYKNFERFIKAMSRYLKEKDLYLVCAGGREFKENEIQLFDELKIKEKILRFDCNDSQLKTLYKNALFFVFPSLYEGFGIPLLEAMGSECPILCSNTSCFPEIAEDSAIYFDPYDIEDMKEKINYALVHDLSEYVDKGKRRFKDFSWDKARKKTMESYKKCL